MALIDCPDCGKQVSPEAVSCPGCGRPVKGVGNAAGSVISDSGVTSQLQTKPAPVIVNPVKSRGTFIILGVLLGWLGIHNFYAGYYARGAVQLLIAVVLGWLIVGLVINIVWVVFELVAVKVDAKGNAMA
ncbi:MAG: TM2 domain-containing protein [Dehalococcoidia bacterium]|nr:TM2 domain-containing protein [Dehalococcoidia bacterium]